MYIITHQSGDNSGNAFQAKILIFGLFYQETMLFVHTLP